MSASDKMSDPQQTTPGRFYGGWSSSEDLPSIKRLMLAVLQDALECLAGRAIYTAGLNPRRSAQEAAEWVADMNERAVFSFNSVCDALSLDAAAVRKALIEWPVSGLRMSRRSPVTREPVELSLRAYRKRSPSVSRTVNNRASFRGVATCCTPSCSTSA
jgi:hypothetical protein